MQRELKVQPEWLGQLVVIRNRAGTQLLLGVRKTECPLCGYGVRVETLWGTAKGEASQVSWCRSCFNAECEPVKLAERQRRACGRLVERLTNRPPAEVWPCARPAIAALEDRGLL